MLNPAKKTFRWLITVYAIGLLFAATVIRLRISMKILILANSDREMEFE